MSAGFPADRVQAALDDLLGWPPIARSPQLASFLSYIVGKKLAGEDSGIKAYSIAVDVFGRPPSFDPQTDPIVRVQARRLRALLEQFYDEPGRRADLRIVLPVGRYVPEFQPFVGGEGGRRDRSVPASSEGVRPTRRRASAWPAALLVAAGLAAAGVVAFLALSRTGEPPLAPEAVEAALPAVPALTVRPYVNLTDTGTMDDFGRQLTASIRRLLAPFEDFAVDGEEAEAAADAYVVGGQINPDPRGVQITSLLTGGGETLWTSALTQPLEGLRQADMVEIAARAIAREIGPFRGPLHDRGRAWLDAQRRPLPAVSPYVCLLTYRLARESGNSTHLADALVCHERLLEERPDLPVAIACNALLQTRARLDQMRPGDDVRELLAEPLAAARRALSLAPGSSLVNAVVGAIHGWRHELGEAQRAFAEALRLNPLNTDARAGYAVALARGPDWTLGVQQAAIAIADSPQPPPWYYETTAVGEWRAGGFEAALDAGLRAADFGSGEMGTLIALAAAGMLGRADIAESLRSRVMTMEKLRLWGIAPWLGAQLTEGEIVESLAEGLRRAGIAEDALTAPF